MIMMLNMNNIRQNNNIFCTNSNSNNSNNISFSNNNNLLNYNNKNLVLGTIKMKIFFNKIFKTRCKIILMKNNSLETHNTNKMLMIQMYGKIFKIFFFKFN